jgi:hypothetical protein
MFDVAIARASRAYYVLYPTVVVVDELILSVSRLRSKELLVKIDSEVQANFKGHSFYLEGFMLHRLLDSIDSKQLLHTDCQSFEPTTQ